MSKLSRITAIISSILMITVLFFPIWKIQLSAPQYPEGLEMKIWANKLTGNIDVINGLNHYIGMRTLHNEDFIEFKILPVIIIGYAILGIAAAIVNRKSFYRGYAILFIVIAAVSMIDFYRWEYSYGHNLDPNAPIQVPGMAYQPPLIGYKKLLNFSAFSFPDIGGIIFAVSGLMIVGTALWEWQVGRKKKSRNIGVTMSMLLMLQISFAGCSQSPQPIEYGKEECAHCRMTIMNPKFAGEIVTQKGKVYKFDDVTCLLSFNETDQMKSEQISGIYLNDFAGKHDFLLPTESFFLRSDELKSPMRGNIAAFSSRDSINAMRQKIGGEEISWKELLGDN